VSDTLQLAPKGTRGQVEVALVYRRNVLRLFWVTPSQDRLLIVGLSRASSAVVDLCEKVEFALHLQQLRRRLMTTGGK
jgi:hypothetical protein